MGEIENNIIYILSLFLNDFFLKRLQSTQKTK